MGESVAHTVRNIEELGVDQFTKYIKSVIVDWTKSINETVKKNSLALFRCPVCKTRNKLTRKTSTLKHDVQLFSRLYIVMQHRNADLIHFLNMKIIYILHHCQIMDVFVLVKNQTYWIFWPIPLIILNLLPALILKYLMVLQWCILFKQNVLASTFWLKDKSTQKMFSSPV